MNIYKTASVLYTQFKRYKKFGINDPNRLLSYSEVHVSVVYTWTLQNAWIKIEV